jgi:hypothetical protein
MGMQCLQQCCEEEKAFVQWIITGNETWAQHYEPASKHQSME